MTPQRILVAIPLKPTLNLGLKRLAFEKAMALSTANAPHELTVQFDFRPVAGLPGDNTPWSRVARARNALLDSVRVEAFDYVLWIDADVVDYPPNLPSRLLAANPGGVTAPMVLIEGSDVFYDWAAFIMKGKDHIAPHDRRRMGGRNMDPRPPYWPAQPTGDVVELDCVGTVVMVPTRMYLEGARYEDHPAFTDHYPICKKMRELGGKVCVDRTTTVRHADLPKWGEAWH